MPVLQRSPRRAATPWEVHPRRSLFAPGRNCWRVAKAGRAATLVDGGPYFAALDAALRKARQSIRIVGWDFDGRILLRPDVSGPEQLPLGRLLRSLVEENPRLEVEVLVWSIAVLHAPGAPLPLLFGSDWDQHPRIKVRLDRAHPIYAAHHQKILTIDDKLAFCGGMDLTVDRWDMARHEPDDPVRRSPDGKPYVPVHDIQMVVDGDAARSLAELVRHRWRVATGEVLQPSGDAEGDVWPEGLEPDFRDTDIAIARTIPEWGGQKAVGEAAILTTDMLRSAERSIYIEAQYMTSKRVGDALAEGLAKRNGPDVVILMTHASRGFLEQLVMGRNRDWLINRLKKRDRYDRLRVYYPVVPDTCGECRVLIHSKLIIVDDRLLRIGSSNLNNRSMGLDTECDLAVEARDDASAEAIARFRRQLLAEHLGVEEGEVADALETEGSMIAAIERLNVGPRGLRIFEAVKEKRPIGRLPLTWLLDPKRPFEPPWVTRRRGRRQALVR